MKYAHKYVAGEVIVACKADPRPSVDLQWVVNGPYRHDLFGWRTDDWIWENGFQPGLPKPTMTETELQKLWATLRRDGWPHTLRGLRATLFAAGHLIVEDPEPSNLERLQAMYDEWNHEAGNERFTEFLDRRGVKAPEEATDE